MHLLCSRRQDKMYPDTKIVSGEFTRKNNVSWKMSPETTADISGDKIILSPDTRVTCLRIQQFWVILTPETNFMGLELDLGAELEGIWTTRIAELYMNFATPCLDFIRSDLTMSKKLTRRRHWNHTSAERRLCGGRSSPWMGVGAPSKRSPVLPYAFCRMSQLRFLRINFSNRKHAETMLYPDTEKVSPAETTPNK